MLTDMDLEQFRSTKRLPFVYGVELTLASSASGTAVLTLQTDSSFFWTGLFGMSTADAATDFMPNNFTLTITTQGTGRNMTNIEIPQRLICAPANGKGALFDPVIFAPNTTLNFGIRNLVAAQHTITLALKGFKLLSFA